ncbi:MAG TPA: hypothetical protein VGL86_29780 [Polyangia bacterium]
MRARRYMASFARLTIFVVTCAAVLGYIDYRVAKASVMERLLGIGQRMAPFMDDARLVEAPREVHMNGLRMWVAAGKSDRSPSEVRRWYAERYAGRGTLNDALAEGLKAAKILPPSVDGLSQASFGDDNMGGMAALDLGSGTTPSMLKTLQASIGKLAAGKIGEVGHLRYLYYERTGSGGTRYLTIWTDDRFDLTKFLPSGGGDDAPGSDIDEVPRFPGTVRVLSADERGRAAQMAVYNGTGSPETASMFYQARMRTLGWAPDPRFAEYAANNGMHSMRFMNAKGHEVVIDLAADDHHGQGLTVTLLQLH